MKVIQYSLLLLLIAMIASPLAHANTCRQFYKNSEEIAYKNFSRNQLPMEHMGLDGTMVLVSMNWQGVVMHKPIIETMAEKKKSKILIVTLFPDEYQQQFKDLIDSDRMKVVDLSSVLQKDASLGNWARDFVGIPYTDASGHTAIINTEYGHRKQKKYEIGLRDLQIAYQQRMRDELGVQFLNLKISGEWGNVLFDENGRVFLTEDSVFNNLPYKDQSKIQTMTDTDIKQTVPADQLEKARFKVEKAYRTALGPLGLKEFVWMPRLPRAIEPTGHIDMYVSIVGPGHVVVSSSNEPESKKILNTIAKTFKSKGYKVDRLPVLKIPGDPTFYSYANVFIYKDVIFIPKFYDEDYNSSKKALARDQLALDYYTSLGFKQVIQVPSYSFIQSQGSIHCATSFFPSYLW